MKLKLKYLVSNRVNKYLTDIIVAIILASMIIFIFYTSKEMDTIYYYAYTRLLYIPVIISALKFNLKLSIIITTIVSVLEFLNIYFMVNTQAKFITFAISIPVYYFIAFSINYFKIEVKRLKISLDEIHNNLKEMEDSLITALEAKDIYTQGHSKRVFKLVSNIVDKMELNENEAEKIKTAAKLHDIGKIGINDNILNKPTKLTEEEFAVIMDHPVMGYEIINKIKAMGDIAKIIRHHHERYDGNGYPDGLKGENIPLGSRIIAIADSCDAMTSKRAYRNSFTMAQAIEELRKNAGKQFDPELVEVFASVIEDLGIDF
ncbi:MAG: HD-GYP domain-containing protein [Thermoanaerobacteraceae bacterium]